MSYDITEHTHRFASWAASRAAQRGFTNSTVLSSALEFAGMPQAAHVDAFQQLADIDNFKLWHMERCNEIIAYLSDNIDSGVTFGRAAKLLAVYLKSTIVIPQHTLPVAHVIYPPIDRILLRKLIQQFRPLSKTTKHSDFEKFVGTARKGWTDFSADDHGLIIDFLLARGYGTQTPFWTIEQWWHIAPEDAPISIPRSPLSA